MWPIWALPQERVRQPASQPALAGSPSSAQRRTKNFRRERHKEVGPWNSVSTVWKKVNPLTNPLPFHYGYLQLLQAWFDSQWSSPGDSPVVPMRQDRCGGSQEVTHNTGEAERGSLSRCCPPGEGHTVVGSYSSDPSEVVCLALWNRGVLQPHFHVRGFSQRCLAHKQLVVVLEGRGKVGNDLHHHLGDVTSGAATKRSEFPDVNTGHLRGCGPWVKRGW